MSSEKAFEKARGRLRLRGVYDAEAVSRETALDTGEETIVQQQFADEVDVNTIVHRFGMNQIPPARLDGVYGDFTEIHDMESAVKKLERARDSFMTVPPEVRERFGNDPVMFAQYASQKDPDELAAELGFVRAPDAPPAAPAVPASPAPAAPVAAVPADGGA